MKPTTDRNKHETIMSKILMDIYKDRVLSSVLGFKGGTAAYFFYDLPRFSVDLDFDLLDSKKVEEVFEEVKKIAVIYGDIKDAWIKRNTILVAISCGQLDRNLKIEISGREEEKKDIYEQKSLYGFSVLVMEKSAMCANKLVALGNRKKTVGRDMFDVYFFLKNDWPIDTEIIQNKTGKNVNEYLTYLVDFVNVKSDSINMLLGLGELVDEKQKAWVRSNLVSELKSLLAIYARKYQ